MSTRRNEPVVSVPSGRVSLEGFNDVAYRLGQYVLSGSEILRCTDRGVWVRSGERQT